MVGQIVPVIMCGGGRHAAVAGLTREYAQAVRALDRTGIELPTGACAHNGSRTARPILITNADFRFVVAEQLRERGIEADIVLEPMRRDSTPAVTVDAVLAAERD